MPKSPFKSIYLERTMCEGDCPVYKVKINAKGLVKLTEKIMFDHTPDDQEWTIDQKAIDKLNEIIHKYGYFTLKKNLENNYYLTDLPYCITKIELQDGTKRKIEHYLGDHVYPKKLITIENWIDKLIEVNTYLTNKVQN